MNDDLKEIFEFQIFRYRFAAFLTALINFFLPPFWVFASNQGTVPMTAWKWATGFEITLWGQTIFTHAGAFSMVLAFLLGILALLCSLASGKIPTFIAMLAGGLATLLTFINISVAEATGKDSVQGMVEIGTGSGSLWILFSFLVGFLICLFGLGLGREAREATEED